MGEEEAKYALLGLIAVFFIALLAFRKRIAYPFCTLQKYTGKISRGKSHYYLITHLLLSLGLAIVCYVLMNRLNTVAILFEDTAIRLLTILLLWIFWILIIGWFIEMYLLSTDKEYKDWKVEYLKK
jgi:hypothetical protein